MFQIKRSVIIHNMMCFSVIVFQIIVSVASIFVLEGLKLDFSILTG